MTQRIVMADTFEGPIEVSVNDGDSFRVHSVELRKVPEDDGDLWVLGQKVTARQLHDEYQIVLRVRPSEGTALTVKVDGQEVPGDFFRFQSKIGLD